MASDNAIISIEKLLIDFHSEQPNFCTQQLVLCYLCMATFSCLQFDELTRSDDYKEQNEDGYTTRYLAM